MSDSDSEKSSYCMHEAELSVLIGGYLTELLKNGKANSKTEQLLEKAKMEHPQQLARCFDSVAVHPFITAMPELLTKESILSITVILENSSFGKERVWENREAVYERLLQAVDDCLANLNVRSKTLLLHPAVRAVLKMEQHHFASWTCERLRAPDIHPLSQHIWCSLLAVIKNTMCDEDCCLLAATALGFFLQSSWNSKTASQIFLAALIEVDEVSHLGRLFRRASLHPVLPKNDKGLPSSALYMLHGLLSCGRSEILLEEDAEDQFVIFRLFLLVAELCRDPKQNVYHAFSTLLAWMKFVHKYLAKLLARSGDGISTEPRFGQSSVLVQTILGILNINWTNSSTGVPELVRKVYSLLIEIHIAEEKFKGSNGTFVETLFERTINQPWTLKEKYSPLAVLISYISFEKVVASYPSFVSQLSESLVSNSLASVGCEVFAAMLRQLKQMKTVSPEQVGQTWGSVFLEPLLDALSDTNSVVQQNAIRYWLPATIKYFPPGIKWLETALFKLERNSRNLKVAVTVLRASRNFSTAALKETDVVLLQRCLIHADDFIRAEAFAVLCYHHKKAEPLSSVELNLLKKYLSLNLNIDSAPFRHQLICNFKVLLGRLRDSSLSNFVRIKKHQTGDNAVIGRSMEFLFWLLDCLLVSLAPGGCYQRRQTCLMLLKTIFEVFWSAPNSHRKGLVPGNTVEFLKYVEECHGRSLLSDKLRYVLLGCILDYMGEIKNLAFTLLTYDKYLRTSMSLSDDHLSWVLELCSSPKTTCSESGAYFSHLLFANLEFDDKLRLIGILKLTLEQQVDLAKKDFYQAATAAPMHSLILALSRVLCHSDSFWKEASSTRLRAVLHDCISLVCDVAFYILGVLAAEVSGDVEASPSFEDMGNAIENIVTTATSSDARTTMLSLEHQLILACCWLSLKESSLFLGRAVDTFLIEDLGPETGQWIDINVISRISDVFMTILLKCRHRGVIEACCLGFELFCQKLCRMSDPNLIGQLLEMHRKALDSISSLAAFTSVTRRSAGLPLLFQTLLKSEPLGQKRPLHDTLQHLLRSTQLPLAGNSSETLDLPQTHALHILRALIHDARVSPAILEYVNDIVPSIFSCFHSESWAIRNAALQAYGSLIPRLLGQKKVSDESSGHNRVDCNGFFEKWQKLHRLFIMELKNADVRNPKMTVLLILFLLGRFVVLTSGSQRYSEELLAFVKPFVDSRSWHVRQMSANAIVSLTKAEAYADIIQEFETSQLQETVCSNALHGWLLILKAIFERPDLMLNLSLEQAYVGGLENCIRIVKKFSQNPVLQAAAYDVLCIAPRHLALAAKLDFSDASLVEGARFKPGYWHLVRRTTYLHLRKATTEELLDFISEIVAKNDANTEKCEACFEYLDAMLQKPDKPLNISFWANIQNLLVVCLETSKSSVLLERCLKLIVNAYESLNVAPDVPSCDGMLNVCVRLSQGEFGSSVAALSVAAWAISIRSATDIPRDCLLWTRLILQHSSPDVSEPYRLSATRALTICGRDLLDRCGDFESDTLHPDNYSCITRILDATLLLLQDEQSDVRSGAAKFVTSLTESQEVDEIHTNVAIKLFENYIVEKLCHVGFIEYFWNKLGCHSQLETLMHDKLRSISSPSISLFEQDDINVFAEKPFISRFYVAVLKGLIRKNPSGIDWLASKLDSVMEMARRTITWLKSEHKQEIGCLDVVTKNEVATHLSNLWNELEILLLIPSGTKDVTELRKTLNSYLIFTWESHETTIFLNTVS